MMDILDFFVFAYNIYIVVTTSFALLFLILSIIALYYNSVLSLFLCLSVAIFLFLSLDFNEE